MCAELTAMKFTGLQLLLVFVVMFGLLPSCGAFCLRRSRGPISRNISCYSGFSTDFNTAKSSSFQCNDSTVEWTEDHIKPRVFKLVYNEDRALTKQYICIYAEFSTYFYEYDLGVINYEQHSEPHPKLMKWWAPRLHQFSHYERSYFEEKYHLFGCLYAGKPTVVDQYHERRDETANITRKLLYCDFDFCNDKRTGVSPPPTRKRKLFDWPEPTGVMARVYDGRIIYDSESDDYTLNYCYPRNKCPPERGDGDYERFIHWQPTGPRSRILGKLYKPARHALNPDNMHRRKTKAPLDKTLPDGVQPIYD